MNDPLEQPHLITFSSKHQVDARSLGASLVHLRASQWRELQQVTISGPAGVYNGPKWEAIDWIYRCIRLSTREANESPD